jgi:hypothetical protein
MIYNEKRVRRLIREALVEMAVKSSEKLLKEEKEDKDLDLEELEGLNLPPMLKKLLDPNISPAQYAKIDQMVDASDNANHQAFAIAAFILSYADMDEGAATQILAKSKGLVPKIIKAREKGGQAAAAEQPAAAE